VCDVAFGDGGEVSILDNQNGGIVVFSAVKGQEDAQISRFLLNQVDGVNAFVQLEETLDLRNVILFQQTVLNHAVKNVHVEFFFHLDCVPHWGVVDPLRR
jgi:hypothetical protein